MIMIRKYQRGMDIWANIEMRDDWEDNRNENMICFWFQVECSISALQL
jgi:hypothetical protein